MKQSNNETIIFFGSSSYVIPIIETLNKNFNLSLVVTTEKKPTDEVPSFCKKNNIDFLSKKQFNNEAIEQLKKSDASLGILADFGLIVTKDILSLFPKGILNVHPSLLPKYRGPTPVQTAILNDEKTTGVSIIKLDSKVDHGPLFFQQKVKILPQDTAKSLYERLFLKSANLLPDVINKYLEEGLKLYAQNHEKATFTKPLTRQDGFVDIETRDKKQVTSRTERMIRAYHPWPGVWGELRIKNEELRIKFLPEKKIQVEGKKPISYKDFLNGYPEAKGILQIIQ